MRTNPEKQFLSNQPLLRSFPTLLIALLTLGSPGANALILSHFDHVAAKWDSGESFADSPDGVIATPSPVNEGAVNFLALDTLFPIYLTSAPQSEGTVSLGLIDRAAWTPTAGDGHDLLGSTTIGDRVYVNVHHDGQVELISARNGHPGVTLGTTTVVLDATRPFILDLDADRNVVLVWYGNEIILDALPFGHADGANPALIGSDFAISCSCICDTGSESVSFSINDRAKGAHLEVGRFPMILAQEPGLDAVISDELFLPRLFDIVRSSETVELVVFLENLGNQTATNVSTTLVAPPGAGITIIGDPDRSFGDIGSGTTTARRFRVKTDQTPVGIHHLTLQLTGGVTQTLTMPISVWEMNPQVLNLAAGSVQISGGTPFELLDVDFIAPETRDFGGLTTQIFASDTFPVHFSFDLTELNARVTHRVPFFGKHPGEAYIADPIFVSAAPPAPNGPQPAPPSEVTLTVNAKDSNGNPVLAAAVEITIELPGGGTTKAQGRFTNGTVTLFDGFGGLPPGNYCLKIISTRDGSIMKDSERKIGFIEPGTYTVNICFPAIPAGGSNQPAPTAPPAPAQATGTEQGGRTPAPPGASEPPPAPTPAPAPPPAPAPAVPARTGRSAGVGVLTGVGTALLDTAGLLVSSPSGPGAVVGAAIASGLGSGLLGTASGVAADPADQDLLYVARENTPPLDPDETTLEETIALTIGITPALSTAAPSVITTQFHYVRTTDRSTYQYNGNDVLDFDLLLSPSLILSDTELQIGQQPVLDVTVDDFGGSPLRGSQVMVNAYLLDDLGIAGSALLNDDGQDFDTLERDGQFSGVIPTTRDPVGYAFVIVLASRSGFNDGDVPGSIGMASKRVRFSGENDLTIHRADDFISLTWSKPGTLSESQLTNPLHWTPLPAAQSPFVFKPVTPARFFRLEFSP